MAPCSEFARDFCAGMGPLQLGVVLVLLKTTRTVLIIALVSAFCRLRFLQQMMLPC